MYLNITLTLESTGYQRLEFDRRDDIGKRLPYTPRSKVRAALRQLFLRSRERAAALKRDGYTCQECNTKQSKAKGREVSIQCHHKTPIDWEGLIDLVYERLLVNEKHLETLCVDCHKLHSDEQRAIRRGKPVRTVRHRDIP